MGLIRKNCRILSMVIILTQFYFFDSGFAGQTQAERPIKTSVTPRETQKNEGAAENNWYAGTFNDVGDVAQGAQQGHWKENTFWLGHKQNGTNLYASISQLERFSEEDYTGNLGCDLNINNYYFHEEAGWGWDTNYIYRFQNITEVSHRLYKNLFWQIGYSYRHYPINDTHLIYPGLIYYFGDNYIRLDYDLSIIESRGTGQFVTLKGSYALTDRLTWDAGASAGEWLYDIYGLPSGQERGYILYTTLNYKINKNTRLGLGYSYGTEDPKFIKRSLNVSVSINF